MIEKDGITGKAMLLPGDDAYWDNLIPPVKKSNNVDEFINNELKKELSFRLRASPIAAFRSISLTFAGIKLVSQDLVGKMKPNKVVAMLSDALNVYDPYTHVGAFELCRDLLPKIPELETIGGQLLDLLSKKPEEVQLKCQVLAAVFIIATAHLAQHATFSARPVFWRRLAAMAHASLAVRHIGIPKSKSDRIIPWAARQSGNVFFVSVFNDLSVEPRWLPEWIRDQMLVADVLGRAALPAVAPASVPASWSPRIDRITKWLEKRHLSMISKFPAALEGANIPGSLVLDGDDVVTAAFRDFIAQPSPAKFQALIPFVFLFGYPKEAGSSIAAVVRALRAQGATLDQDETQQCLGVAAYVSALNKDLDLAGVVADAGFEATRRSQSGFAVREGVCLMLAVAAADPNADNRTQSLVRRLENLAFGLKSPEMCAELSSLLTNLQEVDRKLAPDLNRASAAADLGARQN